MHPERRADVTEPNRIRRGVLVAVAALALTAGCAGNSTTSGSGSAVVGSTAASSAPAPGSGSASAPVTAFPSDSASPAPTGGAESARACADYAAIEKASTDSGSGGKTIGTARTFAAELVGLMSALADDAPAEIHDPAQQLLAAVRTIKIYADKATSLEQLRAQRDSDPTLKAANDTLGTAGTQIDTWRKANC